MKKSWSIIIMIEHEFDQSTPDCKGVGVTEMKVSRVVDGDDEKCDALWAAQVAVEYLRKTYSIEGPIHVKEIEIKECE
jgi:hypothetical protein